MSISSAVIRGFMREGCKRLRVAISSGRRLHQILRGVYGVTFSNPVMKWSFNVTIYFSASSVDACLAGKVGVQVYAVHNRVSIFLRMCDVSK